MKNLIVVEVVNPKTNGPSAYQTHYFDPDNYTIETAKQSLTQWGLVVLNARLES
jgi:5-deoxy-D-glucuronate isomerase